MQNLFTDFNSDENAGFSKIGAVPNLGRSQILFQQGVGQIKSWIREKTIVIFNYFSISSQQYCFIQPKGERLYTARSIKWLFRHFRSSHIFFLSQYT